MQPTYNPNNLLDFEDLDQPEFELFPDEEFEGQDPEYYEDLY